MRLPPLFLAATLVLGGCRFSPQVGSGSFVCGEGDACPDGLQCSPSKRCCAPGSREALCQSAPPADTGAAAQDSGASAPDTSPRPAPAVVPQLVVAGKLSLGSRLSPQAGDFCTQNPSAGAADRWCVFARGQELWVVNVSRSLRAPVRCDGTDAACLRLTSTAYEPDAPYAAYAHAQFEGDLLIFYADLRDIAGYSYHGGVFGWYPGWTAARRLTSENGVRCIAGTEVPVPVCVDGAPSGQFDLKVGGLDPATPLVAVKRFGSLFMQLQLTGEGDSLLFQEFPTARDATSPLWWAPVATASNPATHVLIASEVEPYIWSFSSDGRAVYFVRRSGPMAPAGNTRLSVADPTSPATATDLADRIGYFRVLSGDWRLAALQDLNAGTGVLKLVLGRTTPREVTVGPTSQGFALTADGRFISLRPVVDTASTHTDLRIADQETGAVCTLQKLPQTGPVVSGTFSDNGELVFWSENPDPTANNGEGWLAHTRGCAGGRRFASRMFWGYTLGNRGLLYLDEATDTGGVLRVVTWAEGMSWPPGGAVVVDPDSALPFMVVGADQRLVVFQSRRAGAEGIYVAELP